MGCVQGEQAVNSGLPPAPTKLFSQAKNPKITAKQFYGHKWQWKKCSGPAELNEEQRQCWML